MNRLFLPFAILMVFQAVHISLRACPIEDSYIDADVIFYGKLIERRVDPYLTDKAGNNIIIDRYEVYEFFKGLPEDYPHAWVDTYKQPYIVSVITPLGKAEISSIKSFEPGEKYLLFLKEGSLGLLGIPGGDCSVSQQVIESEYNDWKMQELRILKKMYLALTQDNKDQVKSDNEETSVVNMEDLPPPPPPPPTYYEPFDEVSVLLDNLKFEAAFYKFKEHQLRQQQMALLVISSLLFALLLWALDRRRGV